MRTSILRIALAASACVPAIVTGCLSSDNGGSPPQVDAGGLGPGPDAGDDTSVAVDATSDAAEAATVDSGAGVDGATADAPVDAPMDAPIDTSTSDAGVCVKADGGVSLCDVIVVQVANPGAGLVSYTVPIVLDTRPYVAAGKMKGDCSDLAPYASDRQTPLPYWVSTAECNTATTRLFVQMPALPASATATAYLAYGATPPLPPNGASLFLFFDDFVGTALDSKKWTHWGSGTYSEANGVLTTQYANLLISTTSPLAAGTTAVGVRENGNSAFGDDFEIGAGSVTQVTAADNLWVNSRTGTWASFLSYTSTNMNVSAGATSCGNVGPIGGATFDGSWRDVEWRYALPGNATSASSVRSDGVALSQTVSADGGCVATSPAPVLVGLDHSSTAGANPVTNVDWVYVRAVASPEPAVTVIPPSWVSRDGGADAGDAATD